MEAEARHFFCVEMRLNAAPLALDCSYFIHPPPHGRGALLQLTIPLLQGWIVTAL